MTKMEMLALCRAMVEQPEEAEGWSDDILMSYLTIAGQKILNRAYPYSVESVFPVER